MAAAATRAWARRLRRERRHPRRRRLPQIGQGDKNPPFNRSQRFNIGFEVGSVLIHQLGQLAHERAQRLLGGETAEMPGVFTDGAVDIAGTMVATRL